MCALYMCRDRKKSLKCNTNKNVYKDELMHVYENYWMQICTNRYDLIII